MGGRASRQKGYRAEYALRDAMRGFGLKADRVPSSGAAEGFKGDVKIYCPLTDRSALAEVKSRQNEFKTIYAWYESAHINPYQIPHVHTAAGTLIISKDFRDLGILVDNTPGKHASFFSPPSCPLRKLTSMHKLVKECDFLVIKINNKPFLYIRYLGEHKEVA